MTQMEYEDYKEKIISDVTLFNIDMNFIKKRADYLIKSRGNELIKCINEENEKMEMEIENNYLEKMNLIKDFEKNCDIGDFDKMVDLLNSMNM